MNFLLTWIHWGLAALLYFQNAKLSQAAPAQGNGEKQHSEDSITNPYAYPLKDDKGLMSFATGMEVTLVKVTLKGNKEAVAAQTKQERIGDADNGLWAGLREGRNTPKKEVRIRQEKKSKRGKGKGQKRKRKRGRYKPQNFHCEPCSERRKHLYKQDPQTCKCSCKFTDSRCKSRQLELNERTCRCEKPRR
ncbi:hypothetical protein JD844_025021 [Phrynosoma platyrhinos]|uniref:Vascular endothelial growth factor heparin-binding domain-containing protein n=1 Tax=Phrynosoma platyrhinos TaxID=52577 RepID=A0ABQ7SZ87_PHRPL|nr:hypothetical protein JD844_025021 [Phrynosoma platyrhinos]